MRLPLLFILGAVSAFSQPFSAGVKAGVPFTDLVDTASSRNWDYLAHTNRYIVGLTAELRLPFNLGLELDALYRHLGYTGTGTIIGITTTTETRTTTGNAWEFPLLVKYRFPGEIVRPYIDGGVAWDTLQGLKQTIKTGNLATGTTTTTSSSNPLELNHTTTTGFVLGAGLDVHALLIHLQPEIRYTRWGAKHFLDTNGGINSPQNQAEFLLGITF